MNDPIVEEVRVFRDEHSKKFNYNLDDICEDFKTHQFNCGHKIVRLKPKKIDNKNRISPKSRIEGSGLILGSRSRGSYKGKG